MRTFKGRGQRRNRRNVPECTRHRRCAHRVWMAKELAAHLAWHEKTFSMLLFYRQKARA